MKFKREIAVTTAQHRHTCLPPLHTPFSWEAKQRAFSAGQPLLKPIPIPSRDVAQRSSAAPARPLARCPQGEDVQEELLQVPSLCFGSVVADEDVQEWMGWVVRRGEGRRKSAVLCLRCLGSSCGLLKMSQAGWGAGCQT